ncbi:MAG: gliding motility-associated C-terminal domain-containing protein, partial [Bacteroidetes bacterium]|nr:gliding motility-associated C-terminal domain-containing protein [Bacteroidota bacterium]
GTLTQIVLDTGFHEIIFLHLNTGCMDTLLADVACIPDDGCGTAALSPLAMSVDDCAGTAEFCVSVLVADLPNFLISDNGAAFGGTIGACGLNGNTVAMQLDTGLHELVLEDTVKGCADTFLVQVNCVFVEDVTIDVTIEEGDSLVLCLTDYGYPVADIDSLTVICTGDGNTTFEIDDQTWCITVFGETVGLDTLCFLVNVGDSSGIFTVNIVVVPPCPTFFPGGILAGGVPCSADSGQICLPISFVDLTNKTLTLDGGPYTGTLLPCGFDSLFVLNYDALPNAGLMGPYLIESWSINGGPPFTGVFNTIQELADSMNVWDPTGNWQVVFDPVNNLNLITGGNPLNTYSAMFIKEQISGIEILLGIDLIAVPTGVAVEIPVGTSQLTLTDTLTLCTETVTLELVCLTSDVVIDTILFSESDTFCLDLSELVGTVESITNACPGSNGQIVAFTFENNCVIYTGNEPGQDSACVVVCDDAGLCDTTYFFITVTFTGDSLPVAVNDTIVTGQGQATAIAVLFNDTVQFLTDIYLVDPPANGDVVFLPDGSANYVPDPGYCDELEPDVFTYAICNPLGCDTATVFVTVVCAELEIFNAFSPNDDGTNDFFKINGLQDWPGHHLYVYNRWGNLVFEATSYQSDWSGIWKDKKLPDGTYFYVLDLGDGKKPRRGYVVILR